MRIDGKFNSAVVKASLIDEATISQIKEMCEIEDFRDNNIVIMPDCHAGCGVSIGTTMTINSECINPEYVGVDIGCGVLSLKLKEKSIDLNVIDKIANTKIASGTNIYDEAFKSNDLSAIDWDFIFGHKVLQNMDIIFKWCFDVDKNDGSKYTSYDFFSDEIEFIRNLYDYTDDDIKSRNWSEWVQVLKWCFGENSTFLQYTDEGSDDSDLLFRNTIKEYCEKSKYMVDIKIFS